MNKQSKKRKNYREKERKKERQKEGRKIERKKEKKKDRVICIFICDRQQWKRINSFEFLTNMVLAASLLFEQI